MAVAIERRHVPYGPLPVNPHLTPTSLRLLLHLLLKAEHPFLTQNLPTLYPPAADDRCNPLEWSVAFEVVAFAAGLKPSVLLGWGDGRDVNGDGRVAHAWVKEVWTRGVRQVIDPVELEDKPLKSPDEDLEGLRRFMDGCTFDTLGPVAGRETIWTGHILVSWRGGGPGVKLLTNLASSPTLEELSISNPDPDPRPTIFDESLLAHILDYPLPLPPSPKDRSSSSTGSQNIMITYGLAFSSLTLIGTQYYVPPLESTVRSDLLGTKSVREVVNAHFLTYADRFAPILEPFGGTFALSIQGIWTYGPTRTERKPDRLFSFDEGMGITNLEWKWVSGAERGLRAVPGIETASGRREIIRMALAQQGKQRHRPSSGIKRGKKDASGLSLS